MYILECTPPIKEALIYKYDTKEGAANAAMAVAQKHKVQVSVYKEIKRYSIVIEEEGV